ncbi:MAG: group 1 truncated hemoglobin [Bdellovibrionota bacterium]
MSNSDKQTLFDRLGGRATLEKVQKIFYDKLFAHPWLSQYFVDVEQEHIEFQQTEFLMKLFGGPEIYRGRPPVTAHIHAYITDELFDVRHEILRDSLNEAGIPEDLSNEWLNIDASFRRALIKKSISQCKGRWKTDKILAFENPERSNKKSA